MITDVTLQDVTIGEANFRDDEERFLPGELLALPPYRNRIVDVEINGVVVPNISSLTYITEPYASAAGPASATLHGVDFQGALANGKTFTIVINGAAITGLTRWSVSPSEEEAPAS